MHTLDKITTIHTQNSELNFQVNSQVNSIDLSTFLKNIKNNQDDYLTNFSVISFKGTFSYPVLFFSYIIPIIHDIFVLKNQISFETVDSTTLELGQIKAQLATSFLGSRVCYWLGDITQLADKKQKQLLTYLSSYTGPHIVLLYCSGQESYSSSRACTIELTEKVDEKIVFLLSEFSLHYSSVRVRQAIKQMFLQYNLIPLDAVYLLLHYLMLSGTNSQEFLEDWIKLLFVPDKSLFTLSQYFFARSPQRFYHRWTLLYKDYPDVFWTTYWSEQLFRAYTIVKLLRTNPIDQSEVKRMSYRLPFSFVQRDWRSYQLQELKNAHQFIYQIDHRLKNGGDPFVFDIFFHKFFTNKFI